APAPATAPGADCSAPASTSDPAVERDLRTIVGGSFAVDHLGPDAFAAIEDHVQRSPDAFLDAWARLALDPAGPLDLYWANLLQRTAPARPDRTRALARCLLRRLDQVLAARPADADASETDRLVGHQRSLYLRWQTRPDDGSWRLAEPSSACREGPTLRVEVACTCGEPVECTVTDDAHGRDALVTLDLRAAIWCWRWCSGARRCTQPGASPRAPIHFNERSLPLPPCR
ncbi:MAG: hypothetical protein KDK70_12665, partial [Myxococcales bacterium]|nr:hypothetical protein [Myxococcales bacterium]